MAHELATKANGETAMMYAGEVPWHGLGTYVGAEPVLSEVALQAAGLDYTVEKAPLTAQLGGVDVPILGKYATIRTDTNTSLGVVGGAYQVVQNTEAFAFMDDVAGPGRLVRYHTAGALRGGSTVFLLAAIEDLVIEPVKGDVTLPYLLLANSHDGTSSLRCYWTSVRVVCANTLNLADRAGKGQGVSIRHTGSVTDHVREAQRILSLGRVAFDAYAETAAKLAATPMSDAGLKVFLDALFPLAEDDEMSTQAKNRNLKIGELFEAGAGTEIPGVRGTAWAALNAVTDWADHFAIRRGNKDAAAESSMFGANANRKQRALALLTA